jgi:predicted component of type VI protein secretion system
MKVKLKVLRGADAGKEFGIPIPKCLIGRNQDCHLRVNSEAVSRRHCVLYVREGRLYVRDLKSRNRTFVNRRQVREDCELKSGDEVAIGPLRFEIHIDYSMGGADKIPVSPARQTPTRTTGDAPYAGSLDDSSVTKWLLEADKLAQARRKIDPETRQLKLSETDPVQVQRAMEQRYRAGREAGAAELPATTSPTNAAGQALRPDQGRKVPGKLPPPPEITAEDSSQAASQMLKKLFGRR